MKVSFDQNSLSVKFEIASISCWITGKAQSFNFGTNWCCKYQYKYNNYTFFIYQLPPVNARPVYAALLDFEHPTIYVIEDLQELFKVAELNKVMRQKEDKFFIDVLNKIRVGNVNVDIVKVLKSRFVNLDDHNYQEQALHIFAENGHVSTHNLMMLNKLPDDLVAIHAIDTIPANSGFVQSQILAAQNRKQSESGGLARLLTLKLESKVMLTVKIDTQERLINGQMGVVKYFEIVDNAFQQSL